MRATLYSELAIKLPLEYLSWRGLLRSRCNEIIEIARCSGLERRTRLGMIVQREAKDQQSCCSLRINVPLLEAASFTVDFTGRRGTMAERQGERG